MNKELFVSSTPHETKVGLVEDDLLAEIYLERENEYTLAGSIYKGRVTRVLPGMQSAFVDIGLERDAFLYVSDFMELEEHDEDLTDVVPANRGVQDLRARVESAPGEAQVPADAADSERSFGNAPSQDFVETEEQAEGQSSAAAVPDASGSGSSQDRDRGSYRGRRRRRGGRRDGRSDGRGEGRSEGRDRGPEPRFTRPVTENALLLLLLPQRLVSRNPDEASSLDRRRDTSRFCFPENRFPSTAGWRSLRQCRSGVLITLPRKRASPLRPLRRLPRLCSRLSQTMNLSLLLLVPARMPVPVPLRLLKPRMSRKTVHDTPKRIAGTRHRLPRRQRRWIGTANSGGRRSQAQAVRLPKRSLSKRKKRW